MRFVKKQCAQCPFRKNALPGWLGEYTPGDVMSAVWKGQPFYCHTSINYEDPRWRQKAERSGKLCTGSLVFAKKIMAPKGQVCDPRITSARLAVLKYEAEIECMGPQEFADHHTDIVASFKKLDAQGIRPAPMEPQEADAHETLSLTPECPRFDQSERTFEFTSRVLGSDAWTHVEELLGPLYMTDLMEASNEEDEDGDSIFDVGTVCFSQLIWLANRPWPVLQPHAKEILLAIKALGQGVLVPQDTMKRAEE